MRASQEPGVKSPRRNQRLMGWMGMTAFTLGLLVALALLAIGTFYALSDDPGRMRNSFAILGVNLALISVLFAVLVVRLGAVIAGRSGQAAPILHRRFVMVFSVVALAPAMLVGAFSLSLVTQNIDELRSDNNQGLETARQVLNNYVGQEAQTLLPKAQLVRQIIESDPALMSQRIRLGGVLQRIADQQAIDSLYIIRGDGLVLARAETGRTPKLRVPDPATLALLSGTQTAFQSRADLDYLIVLSRLAVADDTYLYVGDYLRDNIGVLSSISSIEDSRDRLDAYVANTQLLNRTFVLTYIETAMLVLMVAVLLGALLANRIIEPIGRIITASERVRSGDLGARVRVDRNWGEVSDLGGAFNRMTEQLSSQRSELIREHDLAEERRLFSEAVLSGVTAGVVGLSEEGRVTIVNSSAQRLLGRSAGELIDKPLESVLPAFHEAYRKARESLSRASEDQVEVEVDGETRTLDLRVSNYSGEKANTGWVLTFDDMTRLVAAQRNSAWREVARRIAHEIKNPLTPIQLSAERLQLRFGQSLPDNDPSHDVLSSCTETILRAVGNLERMVDEFSAFARMPEPLFEPVAVKDIIDEAVEEQAVGFPDVRVESRYSREHFILADRRLLGQAVTNLLKNAAESATRAVEEGSTSADDALVTIDVDSSDADSLSISIEDNGMGWPEIGRERLLEPYVTTRSGGTGLGLAIASRIVEDHDGILELAPSARNKRGAIVRIRLPKLISEASAA